MTFANLEMHVALLVQNFLVQTPDDFADVFAESDQLHKNVQILRRLARTQHLAELDRELPDELLTAVKTLEELSRQRNLYFLSAIGFSEKGPLLLNVRQQLRSLKVEEIFGLITDARKLTDDLGSLSRRVRSVLLDEKPESVPGWHTVGTLRGKNVWDELGSSE